MHRDCTACQRRRRIESARIGLCVLLVICTHRTHSSLCSHSMSDSLLSELDPACPCKDVQCTTRPSAEGPPKADRLLTSLCAQMRTKLGATVPTVAMHCPSKERTCVARRTSHACNRCALVAAASIHARSAAASSVRCGGSEDTAEQSEPAPHRTALRPQSAQWGGCACGIECLCAYGQ